MIKLRHFWIFEDSETDRLANISEWGKLSLGLLEYLNKINRYKETMQKCLMGQFMRNKKMKNKKESQYTI